MPNPIDARLRVMHVDDAIRTRRTIKELRDEPVAAATVRELLELAVQAPNHHLTEPWRFWVLGPATIERLVEATGDRKLRRSHTAIVVGMSVSDDPHVAHEDEAACAAAIQTLMLAATARGLASYWRTPGVFGLPAFAATIGAPPETRFVGLVHLGEPSQEAPDAPFRSADPVTTWLD